eukprot:161347-Chlamydomonas_euryale.AAC.1
MRNPISYPTTKHPTLGFFHTTCSRGSLPSPLPFHTSGDHIPPSSPRSPLPILAHCTLTTQPASRHSVSADHSAGSADAAPESLSAAASGSATGAKNGRAAGSDESGRSSCEGSSAGGHRKRWSAFVDSFSLVCSIWKGAGGGRGGRGRAPLLSQTLWNKWLLLRQLGDKKQEGSYGEVAVSSICRAGSSTAARLPWPCGRAVAQDMLQLARTAEEDV